MWAESYSERSVPICQTTRNHRMLINYNSENTNEQQAVRFVFLNAWESNPATLIMGDINMWAWPFWFVESQTETVNMVMGL
jgi:hypothetical protein